MILINFKISLTSNKIYKTKPLDMKNKDLTKLLSITNKINYLNVINYVKQFSK